MKKLILYIYIIYNINYTTTQLHCSLKMKQFIPKKMTTTERLNRQTTLDKLPILNILKDDLAIIYYNIYGDINMSIDELNMRIRMYNKYTLYDIKIDLLNLLNRINHHQINDEELNNNYNKLYHSLILKGL